MNSAFHLVYFGVIFDEKVMTWDNWCLQSKNDVESYGLFDDFQKQQVERFWFYELCVEETYPLKGV